MTPEQIIDAMIATNDYLFENDLRNDPDLEALEPIFNDQVLSLDDICDDLENETDMSGVEYAALSLSLENRTRPVHKVVKYR